MSRSGVASRQYRRTSSLLGGISARAREPHRSASGAAAPWLQARRADPALQRSALVRRPRRSARRATRPRSRRRPRARPERPEAFHRRSRSRSDGRPRCMGRPLFARRSCGHVQREATRRVGARTRLPPVQPEAHGGRSRAVRLHACRAVRALRGVAGNGSVTRHGHACSKCCYSITCLFHQGDRPLL